MGLEDFVPACDRIYPAEPISPAPGSSEHLKKLSDYLVSHESHEYSKHERTVKTIKTATEILSGGFVGTVKDRLVLLEALMTHKYREGGRDHFQN
jgi:hypothetical protein